MTDMIERVARALFVAGQYEWHMAAPDDAEIDRAWAAAKAKPHGRTWIDMARAAIATMREPTPAMAEAGGLEVFSCSDGDPSAEKAAAAWPAMIDAALEPPNGPARRDPAT